MYTDRYWSTEPFTLIERRMDHTCLMATARNQSIVVVAGGSNEKGMLNTTETRNVTTKEWTSAGQSDPLKKMNVIMNSNIAHQRRAGFSITEDGKLYTIGGASCGFDNIKVKRECIKPTYAIEYNPSPTNASFDSWKATSVNMKESRSSFAMMKLPKTSLCGGAAIHN